MEPAILADMHQGNPAYAEEFFGPVFLMFRVRDEEQAIRLANDSPFGLAAVIFSADEVRAEALAMQIDAGMVFVNRPAWTAPDVPFGGVKHSGYGRELSELGIQEFVNKKLIEVNSKERSKETLSLEERIRQRAYELYVQRGNESGSELDDWFQAEEEIRRAQEQTR